MPPRFQHQFGQIPIHPKSRTHVQPKLAVGSADDSYEQEADHVADLVMRMPEPQLMQAGALSDAGSKAQSVQQKSPSARLQTKPAAASCASPLAAPLIVNEVLSSPGRPLDAETRAYMEPRFGHDFGRVRIHTDAQAAESARAVHARAFTLGQDVVFARGDYRPKTASGQLLLAHELAHVVQQKQGESILQRQSNPEEESPEKAIEAFTSVLGLDEHGLGVYLYLLAASSEHRIASVIAVIDALGPNDRDEVAYAFIHPLKDTQIDAFAKTTPGSELLRKLRDAMTGGGQWRWESNEIARIDASLRSLKNVLPGFEEVPSELAEPSLPTATIILVGAPTKPGEYDKSPYNFSKAAVEVMPKINEFLPETQVTILYFTPGYKSRGEENGRDVYQTALADLQSTGATVVEVSSADQVINFLNSGLVSPVDDTPTRAVKISRFFYFGHGTSDSFLLDWGWGVTHSLSKEEIIEIKTEAFKPMGKSYLFTCHIAEGEQSFMSVWASHLGQTAIGPQGNAAFNAEYSAENLDNVLANRHLPHWFLGLPYMNRVKIIDAPEP